MPLGCGGDGGGAAAGNETVASADVPFDQAFIDAMVLHHGEAIKDGQGGAGAD